MGSSQLLGIPSLELILVVCSGVLCVVGLQGARYRKAIDVTETALRRLRDSTITQATDYCVTYCPMSLQLAGMTRDRMCMLLCVHVDLMHERGSMPLRSQPDKPT